MKKQKRQNHIVKNEKLWKIFYNSMFFLGMILMLLEISIYRKTIVNIYTPISIVLTVGLFAFILNKKHYKRVFSLTRNFIPLIQSLGSWGFITCSIFMAANYYLAEKTVTKYEIAIKEKSSMPGSKGRRGERQPLVRIKYFDIEKELVFRYSETEKVNNADSVAVTIKKGLLGFDILQDYKVLN